MKEVFGDLWEYHADVKCITTNGSVTPSGFNIMGGGCAREAAVRWPILPGVYGKTIKQFGLRTEILAYPNLPWERDPDEPNYMLIAFPVKYQVWEPANLVLIKRSAEELVDLMRVIYSEPTETILLPRPGCGLGRLNWERDVKPVLEPILDDRFHIIGYERERPAND